MAAPHAAVRYRHPDGQTRLRDCRSTAELERLMADRDGAMAAELVTRDGDDIHLVDVVWSEHGCVWACECGARGYGWSNSTDIAYCLAEAKHPIGCPWLLLADATSGGTS